MNTIHEIADELLSSEHYEFQLPKELIAQYPLSNREDARLLQVNRSTGGWAHQHVRDLDLLLQPGDCLVLNDTAVIPAQLVGQRVLTGGRWQGLVLATESQYWKLLAKTRGRIQVGERVLLFDSHGKSRCELLLLATTEDGCWIGQPLCQTDQTSDPEIQNKSLDEILRCVGRVPLPHYIRGGNMADSDVKDYQTVFAKQAGAIAAPTAGLHFTTPLLRRIIDRGIKIVTVTLHVGIGTFRPVTCKRLEQHTMHGETGSISPNAAQSINQCREQGGRAIAVGTTCVRLLESAAQDGQVQPWSGSTDLFIRPGHPFQIVDGLLTNFHLPKTTLIVLVRTFGGDELIANAYAEAIREKYRFFSYGDAMLIL